MVPAGAPAKRESDKAPQFKVGDTVTVRADSPIGHTRRARYIRGRTGEIVLAHGTFIYPDAGMQADLMGLTSDVSGGNWHINTGNGYYGGLQFSASTWRAYGGTASLSVEVEMNMGHGNPAAQELLSGAAGAPHLFAVGGLRLRDQRVVVLHVEGLRRPARDRASHRR